MAKYKTYYCVTSRFFNNGSMNASITASSKEVRCPQASFTSTPNCDIYHDWFASYLEATQFVKETKALHDEMKQSKKPPDRGGWRA